MITPSQARLALGVAIAIAIALILTTLIARAGERDQSRAFYDKQGSFSGSTITHGNSTSAYDKAGRFDGTAIRNSGRHDVVLRQVRSLHGLVDFHHPIEVKTRRELP